MSHLPRTWLYGLTADEWLHLAAEGEDSEVQPCCGNLGQLRELLNALATFQSGDDTRWQLSVGRHVLEVLEGEGEDGDGYGHGLGDRGQFPLLHRVLDGIRAQQADPDPFGLRPVSASGPCATHGDAGHPRCLNHECCIGHDTRTCKARAAKEESSS